MSIEGGVPAFVEMLGFGFIQRALLAGILIGLLCSVLGVFLVLRRFSLIGDGLAHFTFGSVALAMLLGVAPEYVTMAALPLVLLAAVGILWLSENTRIAGDAAIGIVSALGIAGGVILASLAGGFNVDLLSYLFGNILAIGDGELLLAGILCGSVLLVVALCYRDLFAVTFDEEFARTTGVNSRTVNVLLALLAALTVVLAMKLVGIMLISALLILPPAAALQVARSFLGALLCSAALGTLSVAGGILASIAFNLPTGGTIIVTCFGVFVAAAALRRFVR
jgi:zinc transport system permease protein